MPRVNTNNVAVAYTTESALGVAGTSWRLLEPNSIADFGATISTVARDPISRDRQRRKGSITDLDSAVGLESDLTMASFRNFIEGFCFATGENTDVTGIPSTGATGTGNLYTVASVTAGQSPKLEVGTLLWVEGFATPLNNGLQSIGTDVVTGATTIAVTGSLTTEAGASGRISFAGYRDLAATRPTWRWSMLNNQATLAKTGHWNGAQEHRIESWPGGSRRIDCRTGGCHREHLSWMNGGRRHVWLCPRGEYCQQLRCVRQGRSCLTDGFYPR